MAREMYVPKSFNIGTRRVIRQANSIIEEYRGRGFVLTLRQLYYQFVQRGLIKNEQKEYKKLGSIINDARLAGQIDWTMIEDRTRNVVRLPWWDHPRNGIEALAGQFRTDIWSEQPTRVEVWIEKEALVGVVEPAARELRVPYFACKGNNSQSEQWRAGKRFKRYRLNAQKVVVLYLGDHDPNGVDMSRDNERRLRMFMGGHPSMFDFRRIALNMDQVEELNLIPNPVKMNDSRSKSYVDKFADESWELDALDPDYIDNLIREAIEPEIDRDAWNTVEAREDEIRSELNTIATRYEQIAYLARRPDYE